MKICIASNHNFFGSFSFEQNTSYDTNTFEPISSDDHYSENGQTEEEDSTNTLRKVMVNTNGGHLNFKQETFEQTDDNNARYAGVKRPKIAHSIVHESLGNYNGIIITGSSSNGFESLLSVPAGGTTQVLSKSVVNTDDNAIFCDFIASELRNLKTDQFRRKLKLMFHKCLVEVTAEEEALLAKRDV